MSQGALRAALAVFALGALGVWLVKPIGDACPDVGRLPAGSQSSSSPSFAPPLTRTCTYTTADGTDARKRYVPIVDWLIVAVVAGVVGAGVGLAGPGSPGAPRPARSPPAPRRQRAARARKPARAKRATRTAAPPRSSEPAPSPGSRGRIPGIAPPRERERQERARRRTEGCEPAPLLPLVKASNFSGRAPRSARTNPSWQAIQTGGFASRVSLLQA